MCQHNRYFIDPDLGIKVKISPSTSSQIYSTINQNWVLIYQSNPFDFFPSNAGKKERQLSKPFNNFYYIMRKLELTRVHEHKGLNNPGASTNIFYFNTEAEIGNEVAKEANSCT